MGWFDNHKGFLTMNKFLRNSLAIVAIGAAVGAHAQGLYIGGALSAPDYRDPVNGFGDGNGGSGPGLKLYGGWQFTPNFALEGGLVNFGRTHDTNGGSAHGYGAFVDAVGRWEFTPGWSVLGSAGLAQARLKTPAGDDTSPALKLGVGLQYDLSRTTSLRLGYEHYKFNDAFDAKLAVGQTTFGMNFAF